MEKNEKVNILYVSHYPHYRMGGQKSMLALIENLNTDKFKPIVLAPEEGELLSKARQLYCKTYQLELYPLKPKNFFKVLSTIRKIIKIVNDNNISIIHTDTERDAFVFGIAKYFTKAKLIWHSRLSRPDSIDSIITKFADGIILISNDIKYRFKNFSKIENKTSTIFNGVFCDIFKPIDSLPLRNQYKLPKGKFIVSFIGQLNEGKGIFDILEAAKLFNNSDERSEVLFLLIGKANDKEVLKKIDKFISQNNLEEIVRLIEHQKDIHKWMQASDIIILPSFEGVEGMGRVLIEGMACGKPVIGTRISGIKEAISKDVGILIDEKSPNQIYDAVNVLINDKDLYNSYSIAARQRALSHFDIIKHAKNVEDFYFKILQ